MGDVTCSTNLFVLRCPAAVAQQAWDVITDQTYGEGGDMWPEFADDRWPGSDDLLPGSDLDCAEFTNDAHEDLGVVDTVCKKLSELGGGIVARMVQDGGTDFSPAVGYVIPGLGWWTGPASSLDGEPTANLSQIEWLIDQAAVIDKATGKKVVSAEGLIRRLRETTGKAFHDAYIALQKGDDG